MLYNEAGEQVKLVIDTPVQGALGDVIITVDGVESNVMTSGSMLSLYFDGITNIDSLGENGTTFVMDALSDRGQLISSGTYYLKIEQEDAYGHTTVKTTSVSMIKVEEYVELRIYNSAGELVRTIKNYSPLSADSIALNIDDVISIDKYSSEVKLVYGGPTDFVSWDGKNNTGELVSSGTYEIQVVVKTATALAVSASKTVTVLNEAKEFLGEFRVYPNPYNGVRDGKMTFEWEAQGEGKIRIFIYSMTGELVHVLEAGAAGEKAEWDLKTSGGSLVTHGIYVCVLEGVREDGYREFRKTKAAVIYKPEDMDGMYNNYN